MKASAIALSLLLAAAPGAVQGTRQLQAGGAKGAELVLSNGLYQGLSGPALKTYHEVVPHANFGGHRIANPAGHADYDYIRNHDGGNQGSVTGVLRHDGEGAAEGVGSVLFKHVIEHEPWNPNRTPGPHPEWGRPEIPASARNNKDHETVYGRRKLQAGGAKGAELVLSNGLYQGLSGPALKTYHEVVPHANFGGHRIANPAGHADYDYIRNHDGGNQGSVTGVLRHDGEGAAEGVGSVLFKHVIEHEPWNPNRTPGPHPEWGRPEIPASARNNKDHETVYGR
ncbi:hypothetical protein HOP50_08g51180 [Chloropicon primus]|nr:hypothetical protein A3770_08p50920 [Chloropicon primus]UPR01796.1 hypothetical protein HOP50_08g51180 [Chloropicon primus]|eukprot:QDZ22574.1 hypothetical protein A3770_08p50920 [Chloropicon primus]